MNRESFPYRVSSHLHLLLAAALLVGLGLSLWSAGVGYASIYSGPGATIIVNTFDDVKQGNDGLCSLREAIIAANSDKPSGGKKGECDAGSGIDTILLPAGTYSLARTDKGNEDASQTGDLDIFGDVRIEGADSTETIIDANGIIDRAFHVLSGNVEIYEVTVTKSNGPLTGDGAAIRNSGNLLLSTSTITGARASGSGGGIYNDGVLTLFDSTVSNNTASDSGGGIANTSSGSVALNNSTVSGNSASNGGGIFNLGILELHNVTVAYNSDGGGVVNSDVSGTVNFRNTIIAANDSSDCSGRLSSQGYNLIQSVVGCIINDGATNITGEDPQLGSLHNNGGETQTLALLPGSPAIDAGNPQGCFGSNGLLTTDQRGVPRPEDGDSNGSFVCDIGAYEVGRGIGQSALVLLRVFPDPDDNGDPTAHGLLDGAGQTLLSDFDLRLFANDTACDPSNLGDPLVFAIPPNNEKTDENGYFIVDQLKKADNEPISSPVFLTATATDPKGGAPLQSNCVPFSAPNDSWPDAVELTLQALVDDHYIDSLGQSRWYKFKVEPNGKLFITLSGVDGPDAPLPADYDLTLYSDLEAAFQASLNPDSEDLVRLSAEFAGSSFSGSSFSGSSFSGSSFSGSSFSSISYSGSSFSGSSFSGSSFSGSSFSGSSFSGDAYGGSSFSGSSFSGSSFSGSSFSGSSFSEAVFGGENYSRAFADAQSRSLLAISAFGGTMPESIFVRTWNSNEFYYVRVRGRNGAFSLDAPFRLEVNFEAGSCGGVQSLEELGSAPIDPEGNPTTLILYDSTRLDQIVGSEEIDLEAKFDVLANHPKVDGMVIDVGEYDTVRLANEQADQDQYRECPFAKNVVAQAIREIINAYRTQPESKLEYVVLVGGDAVIPFFRHPDNADLARESQFVPPVRDDTPSQAALKLDYVLSQDAYVAETEILVNNNPFPIPAAGVAAGRLVETAAEISAVIDAFLEDNDGVVQPQSSLATGYDFLADVADEIADQLELGTGADPVRLITPFGVDPTSGDESIWTADDLRDELLGSRHDLVFLAGHFSGHSALAADYQTQMLAEEVANSAADLRNSIIFSIGCHAGYNIVNQDEVPDVPRQPDWAQAFASQGATLIAGTGYQYGETETVEYSERLYIEFSEQLRRGTGSISIGHALNRAKRDYLTQIPKLRALHEKTLLEASIFGLPMLSVNMPGERFTPASDTSIVTALSEFHANPGAELGLKYADIDVTSPLHVETRTLTDLTDPDNPPQTLTAEFLSGNQGVVTNPTEPFLPLEVRNVTVPGMALRGVGFRGGIFQEKVGILPLTGAPTTEAVALHLAWQTDFFHPIQMWNANYIGALIDGRTRVLFTPAQHMAGEGIYSNRLEFSGMNYRLFFSNNTTGFGDHTPALSAPPLIARVSAIHDDEKITFRATVVGDPSAGMQAVWVTWTDTSASCVSKSANTCTWQSLDLTQRESDSTMWEGTLPLNGSDPQNIRYMVQVVNGIGGVSLAANFGYYFTPGVDATPTVETRLTLEQEGGLGVFEDQFDFSAVLEFKDSNDGQFKPLVGRAVEFRLGEGLRGLGVTDGDGRATVTLNLLGLPGEQKLRAGFAGTAEYQASSAVATFSIKKQNTSIVGLADATAFPNQDPGIQVTLFDGNGQPLRERTVLFVVTVQNGDPYDLDDRLYSAAVITNRFGQASLGPVDIEDLGDYEVRAFFIENPLVVLADDVYNPSAAGPVKLTIVASPCDPGGAVAVIHDPRDPDAEPPPPSIWEPNGKWWRVDVVTNAGVAVTIDSVFQDEEVGADPDARLIDGDANSVELRAERDGGGNGRFYHIFFTAHGGQASTCEGQLAVPVVPHDQSDDLSGDGGALYDSMVATKFAPVASDDQADTDEDTPVTGNVLDNDTDQNPHDILTVTAVNGADVVGTEIVLSSGARLTVQSTGVYAYNPTGWFDFLAAGGSATDSFGYTVDDGNGGTDVATVTIRISGVNDPPVAVDDSAVTGENTSVTGNVLDNDRDVDGDTLQANLVGGPKHGQVNLMLGGGFTYAPQANFSGNDSFTYQASDGISPSNVATVTISVNASPVAGDDAYTALEDTILQVTAPGVLSSDTDLNGDPLTAILVTDVSSGLLTLYPDGGFGFVPDSNFAGTDTFTYKASDGSLESNPASVVITVQAVNDPPVAGDDRYSTAEDTLLSVAAPGVLSNDGDVDGDGLTAGLDSNVSNGMLSLATDGSFTYTPDPGFVGTDSFTYRANDGLADSNLVAVTITISAVNNPPAAEPDLVTTTQGISVTFDPLADNGSGADTDPDQDPLTVIEFSQGARGTVISNNDGTLTYTPNSSFKGSDSFTYTISDGKGGTDMATVTVEVIGKKASGG